MFNKNAIIAICIAIMGFALLFIGTDSFTALVVAGSGGGGGAPTDAEYVTLSTDAALSDERVLTGTLNQIAVSDGGANSPVTLSAPQDLDTGADVHFGTGLFDGQTTASDPAVIMQNLADATDNVILQLTGPDRATPANDDQIVMSFMQEITSGFVEVARIEARTTDVGASTESSIRWKVMDSGSLQLSAVFENDDISLVRNGGSYRMRSSNGITVDIHAASQTSGTTVFLTIPDAGDAADTFVLADAIQTLTNKTIDGDDNTLVDIKPDQFDTTGSATNGDCLTYQSNQIAYVACGGGTIAKSAGIPLEAAATPSACSYRSVPNAKLGARNNQYIDNADTMYAPFYVEKSINIGCYHIESPGAVSLSCRVAIYEASENWQPGSLVVDFGAQSLSAGGATLFTYTVDQDLDPGSYLSAVLCDASQQLIAQVAYSDIATSQLSSTAFSRNVYNWNVGSPSNTAATAFPSTGDQWDQWDVSSSETTSYMQWITYSWTVN